MTNQLRWKITSAYHAISECGNYHVSKSVIGTGEYFDSWYGSTEGKNLRHLHGSCDKAAAIQACETDLQQLQRDAATTKG